MGKSYRASILERTGSLYELAELLTSNWPALAHLEFEEPMHN